MQDKIYTQKERRALEALQRRLEREQGMEAKQAHNTAKAVMAVLTSREDEVYNHGWPIESESSRKAGTHSE
jgi:hypothetical protein